MRSKEMQKKHQKKRMDKKVRRFNKKNKRGWTAKTGSKGKLFTNPSPFNTCSKKMILTLDDLK